MAADAMPTRVASVSSQVRLHLLLLLSAAVSSASASSFDNLEENFPEFAQLSSGGGGPNLPANSDKDRATKLNLCSMCEATTYQAAEELWKLKRRRDAGITRFDASDIIEELCSTTNPIWANAYSMKPGDHIGLIIGPGISFDANKKAGLIPAATPEEVNYRKGVANRFQQACLENLSGGDLDEEQLYEIVKAAGIAQEKHAALASSSRGKKSSHGRASSLTRRLCYTKDMPCDRYLAHYSSAAAAAAMRDEL